MEREEIIKEIIRLGNLLLEEEKKENPVEDDYESDIERLNPNQCGSIYHGDRCHRLVGHFGKHHNVITNVRWGRDD